MTRGPMIPTPRWFEVVEWDTEAIAAPWERRYWRVVLQRLRGTLYRVLVACGVWQVGEGSVYSTGRLVWQNDLARHLPTWPANGAEWWGYVLGTWVDAVPGDYRPGPCGLPDCRIPRCREAAR